MSSERSRAWRRIAWRPVLTRGSVLGSALILTIGLSIWSIRGVYTAYMNRRLLTAFVDASLADPELVAFAAMSSGPLYNDRCARCHGLDLRGNPAIGAPNLIDSEWIYGRGAPWEIEQTILYGIRSGDRRGHDLADMPAFGTPHPYRRYAVAPLGPEEISDVVDYVRATAGVKVDPDVVARGRAVFTGSGQCADCHAPDARGDENVGAPSLVDAVWLYGHGTRRDIIASVTNGRAGTCPAWYNRLTAAQIRALAVFIASRAPHLATQPRLVSAGAWSAQPND